MANNASDFEMDGGSSTKTQLAGGEKKQSEWTTKEKCLLVLLIASVLVIIVIAIVLALAVQGVLSSVPSSEQAGTLASNGEASTCTDVSCLQAAIELRSGLNTSVDPCEDFYRFACEGWMARNPRPPTRSRWTPMSKLFKEIEDKIKVLLEEPVKRDTSHSFERKLKNFYLSCLDSEASDRLGDVPIKNVVDQIGGWKAWGPGSWDEANWDVTQAVFQVQTLFTGLTEQFFKVSISADDKDPDVNILKIDQGGLGLPNRELYFENETESEYIQAYKRYLQKTAELMGVAPENATQFAEEVFQFEEILAVITYDDSNQKIQNPVLTYNKVTVAELTELAPAINWTLLLSVWIDEPSNSTKILVFNKEYVRLVAAIIGAKDKGIVNHYVIRTLLSAVAQTLSGEFQTLANDFTVAKEGLKKPKDRWEQCQTIVSKDMWQAVSALFIRKHFSMESKQQVIEMIKYFKRAFKTRIDQVKFLDEPTRKLAHEKLDAMKYSKIGFPDYMLNDTYMDDLYKDLEVDCTNCTFSTLMGVAQWKRQQLKEKLRNPVDKEEWTDPPHKVNAYYKRKKNEMLLLAGIMQPPIYTAHYPRFIHFATIGHVIGHEITHGFDTGGSRYDKDGNLNNWWTNSSWTKFETDSECVADFYTILKIDGLRVNGRLTLTENLADIGGLKLVKEAYELWTADNGKENTLPGANRSVDELLFVANAQKHCVHISPQALKTRLLTDWHSPGPIRANGATSQTEAFSTTFKCPRGSPMNPWLQCNVW